MTVAANRVPAGVPTGGQFAASARSESGVGIGAAPAAQPAPLTASDLTLLRESRGALARPYSHDEVSDLLGSFESALLMAVWETYDEYDHSYSGDFEVFGQAHPNEPVGAPPAGTPWMHLHPDVRTHLFDTDPHDGPGVDLDQVPSLLDGSRAPAYGDEDVDAMAGAMRHSAALGDHMTADADEPTDEPDPGAFSATWPRLDLSDRQWGTVRTTNGGEVSGYLSTYGSTFGVDVETPSGRYVTVSGWRVDGVRLGERPPGPFDTPGVASGVADATTVFEHLRPVDGTDWTSLRTAYSTEHPVVMAALRDDLLRNGMKTPVVVRDGKVENGQHRVLAASDVGVPIRWAAWTGDEPKTYWDPESREHYSPEDDEHDEGQPRY